MKLKPKLYTVHEHIFIEHELVEIINEMWTKQELNNELYRLHNNGFEYTIKRRNSVVTIEAYI